MKMLLKVSVLALSLLGFGQGVNANVPLGPVGVSGAAFSNNIPGSGSFTDYYDFTLLNNSGSFDMGASAIAVFTVPSSVFTKFGMSLYDTTDSAFMSPTATLTSGSLFGSNTYLIRQLNYGALDRSHNFTLSVNGTATSLGGSYGGSISVSPVPEPETWAMLLIGTVLLGMKLSYKGNDQYSTVFSA